VGGVNNDPDCPGAGKCHGCMCWCDVCGDVDTTCDSVQGECSRHHCISCKQLLGKDDYNGENWSAACFTCATAAINEDRLVHYERALAEGDFIVCDLIAGELAVNPIPYLGSMARPWGTLLQWDDVQRLP
jgi:hypothetical protein